MKPLISTALLLAWGAFSSSAQVVDVHSHIIPGAYMDFLRAHHAELQETFPLPRWDVDSHLAFMDEMGMGCSVLSLPAPQPYFGDSAESAAKVRQLNELAAKVRDNTPTSSDSWPPCRCPMFRRLSRKPSMPSRCCTRTASSSPATAQGSMWGMKN